LPAAYSTEIGRGDALGLDAALQHLLGSFLTAEVRNPLRPVFHRQCLLGAVGLDAAAFS